MLCLRCLGHAVVVVYIRRQHARIYSYVVRTKKSPANTMGQEGSSSKAEQSMKRKGKGSFRQALRRQKSETVKTRIRRTSPRAKKANKFRRVPQQLFSSSAITGGEMGGYAEHVLRSRRDLSVFMYERERTGGRRVVLYPIQIGNTVKSFAHHQLLLVYTR